MGHLICGTLTANVSPGEGDCCAHVGAQGSGLAWDDRRVNNKIARQEQHRTSWIRESCGPGHAVHT